MKLLIVEDDRAIREALKEGLEDEKYAVDVAEDGQEGYLTAQASDYDAIIMDVMMPEMDGFEVVKKLREDGNSTPILMLTAKSEVEDTVAGLDFGADDYLAKPFNFEVLLARIRALLRRPKDKIDEVLRVADLSLDPATKAVERAGSPIKLTAKEYTVLEFLMRNAGTVRSKDDIIAHCWDFDSDILPNNVEIFVMFLRRKIDKPFDKKLIHTVSGFGYKIEDLSNEK
ncbi:MAG: response regulator transcription factor [bacterium]|nr:response regulator transcription factor [bacterium]